MTQVRMAPARTSASPLTDRSSHRRACRAYEAFTRGVPFRADRATYYRKLRAPSQEPNPLARVMAHVSEAHRAGATEAQARALVTALAEHIEAEYGAVRVWSRDLVLEAHRAENEQNMVEATVICGPETADALRAYAKATRRAAIVGLIAADAADTRAAQLQWGAC